MNGIEWIAACFALRYVPNWWLKIQKRPAPEGKDHSICLFNLFIVATDLFTIIVHVSIRVQIVFKDSRLHFLARFLHGQTEALPVLFVADFGESLYIYFGCCLIAVTVSKHIFLKTDPPKVHQVFSLFAATLARPSCSLLLFVVH